MEVTGNCKVCHGETGDDGYGEPVHLATGLYWHGDLKGHEGHVAV